MKSEAVIALANRVFHQRLQHEVRHQQIKRARLNAALHSDARRIAPVRSPGICRDIPSPASAPLPARPRCPASTVADRFQRVIIPLMSWCFPGSRAELAGKSRRLPMLAPAMTRLRRARSPVAPALEIPVMFTVEINSPNRAMKASPTGVPRELGSRAGTTSW